MNLTEAQLREVQAGLSRASRRLKAGLTTARRIDAEAGELENAFEGIGNAINMIASAYVLASTGRRRGIEGGESAMILRHALAQLRTAGIAGLPEPEDLLWVNTRRNTSAHEGAWLEVIDVEQVETAAGYGRAFLAGVEAWLQAQRARGRSATGRKGVVSDGS